MPNYYQLDRSESFGEITPPDGLAHYDQNGFLYDARGVLIEARLSKEQKEKLKKLEARAKAAAEAERVRMATLKDLGFSEDDIANDDEEANQAVTAEKARKSQPGEIDLRAWALGQISPSFDKVQAAIRDKYGKQCTKLIDALEFLSKEMKVPIKEMRAA